jgi:hypothetical protein
MEITTGKHAAAAEAMRETASGRPRGDGDEAEPVAALKLADGAKQAEAGKGKRIGKVSQKYIDIVLNEKATGTGAYRKRTATESYRKYVETCTSPRKEELRALVARGEAVIEQLRAGRRRRHPGAVPPPRLRLHRARGGQLVHLRREDLRPDRQEVQPTASAGLI